MNARTTLKKYQIGLMLAQQNYARTHDYKWQLEIYELEELVKHAQKLVH